MALRGCNFLRIYIGESGFELLYGLRHLHMCYLDTRTGLVEGINSLVGEIAVGHIAVGKFYTCLEGIIGVCNAVMVFVFTFDIIQYHKGLLGRGRLYHHLLETTLERAVFLDIHAIFVEGGGTDALDFATGKGRLEHVGRIHRALGVAGSDDCVDFVDKQDNVGVLGKFV